jgi:hypothetical protein
MCQPPPAYCSIKEIWSGPEVPWPESPTAQQSLAPTQVTLKSSLFVFVLPEGLGLETILHPLPVFCSISVWDVAGGVELLGPALPTAQQSLVLTHVTPSRLPPLPAGRSGLKATLQERGVLGLVLDEPDWLDAPPEAGCPPVRTLATPTEAPTATTAMAASAAGLIQAARSA